MPLRRLLAAALLALALLAPATALGADALRAVPGNPADKLAELPVDPYRYDRATRCLKRPQAGTAALQGWLQRNARGASWGIMRCEKWGKDSASLHAEGRALDWHLNVHDPADRRAADRLLELLLAPDRNGVPHALARRMGIQELIWNCRSWWSGSAAMGRYSRCYDDEGRRVKVDDTNAHRDHIHIGLNWPGARLQSSFWARGEL